MAVRFDCSHCKANYEVADDLAGKMIMCRVCKKRAAVRGSSAQPPSLTAAAALAKASQTSSVDKSRRNFIIGISLASLGAIGAGALLARQPWRHWKSKPPQTSAPDGAPDQRRRRGPPPDGKNDNKGGAA
jgi:hypothetical protein